MYCRNLFFLWASSAVFSVNSEETSTDIPPVELCVPSQLEVAKLEPTRVKLGWSLTEDAGCSVPETLEFSVAHKNRWMPLHRFTVMEPEADLNDLSPGAKYSVEIRAIHGSDVSGALNGSFTTLAEDWPSPELDVSLVRMENQSHAYVQWDIDHDDSLSEFESEICAPKCITRTFGRTDRVTSFALDFSTKYRVKVRAKFSQPLGAVWRESPVVEGLSPVGPPSGNIKILSLIQTENMLDLAWSFPEEPNGPVSYYDLAVSDATDRSSMNQTVVFGPNTRIELPPMSGYEFIVEIRAVNVDPLTKEKIIGAWTEYPFIRKLPDKPLGIKVVGRRTDSLNLEVVASSPHSASLRYHVVTGRSGGEIDEEYVASQARVRNLTTFQNITIFASACYSDWNGKFYCGEDISDSATSNVDAPSVVRNLTATFLEEAILLSWKEPIDRNGPIEGYMIFINASDESSSNISDVSVASSLLSFTFDRVDGEKSYEFSVAAFNSDLETTRMLLGEKSAVGPLRKPSAVLDPTLIATVVVVVIVVGALGIVFLSKFRRKPDASPPTTAVSAENGNLESETKL